MSDQSTFYYQPCVTINNESIITTPNLYNFNNNVNFKLLDSEISFKLPPNVLIDINGQVATIACNDPENCFSIGKNTSLEIFFDETKFAVSQCGIVSQLPMHPLNRYYLSLDSTFVIHQKTRVFLFNNGINGDYIDCQLTDNYKCKFYFPDTSNDSQLSHVVSDDCIVNDDCIVSDDCSCTNQNAYTDDSSESSSSSCSCNGCVYKNLDKNTTIGCSSDGDSDSDSDSHDSSDSDSHDSSDSDSDSHDSSDSDSHDSSDSDSHDSSDSDSHDCSDSDSHDSDSQDSIVDDGDSDYYPVENTTDSENEQVCYLENEKIYNSDSDEDNDLKNKNLDNGENKDNLDIDNTNYDLDTNKSNAQHIHYDENEYNLLESKFDKFVNNLCNENIYQSLLDEISGIN